ncbi:MAG: hypothetical protein KC492_35750 [Myxococcales bacterium]|nr:hypothetical protein [Myxococcales bacterium]
MLQRWLVGLFAMVCLVSCHRTEQLTPRSLLEAARADRLATFSRYRERTLQLDGVVVDRSWEKSGGRRVPLLVLRDSTEPRAGLVLCYFDEGDLDPVAQTPLNTFVRVRGQFKEFIQAKGELAALFHSCDFRD